MEQKIKRNMWLFHLVWKSSKLNVVMIFFNSIINPIRNLGVEVLFIRMIYNAIDKQSVFTEILPVLSVVMILFLINGLLETIYMEYISKIGMEKLHQDMSKMLIQKAASVPLSSFDDKKYFDEFIFSAKNGADQALNAVRTQAFFCGNLIGSIFAFGIIAIIDPTMLVFSIISLVISLYIVSKRNHVAFQYDTEKVPYVRKGEYFHKIFYQRNYAQELRLFPLHKILVQNLEEISDETKSVVKKNGIKVMIWDILQHGNQNLFMYWGAMLYVAYKVAYEGSLQVSDVLVATVAVGTISLLMGAVVGVIPQLGQNARYGDKLYSFLNRKVLDDVSLEKKDKIPSKVDSLKVDNLTFTYPNETIPTLKNISFEIKKGQRIAIVGNNGSGKTTLVKLLMRFYDPDSGSIFLNDKDIKNYENKEYQALFGTVFQDFNAYALSVKDNIIMEAEELQKEKLSIALQKSGLSLGADVQLTREFDENGLVLSGGQLQKMAIARIYYRDSSIVILDEPSSALDPEAEYEMMQNMMKLSEDRIVIMISHRLSNIKDADSIIYLENGIIKEHGSHQDLMKNKGKYYEMYSIQADQYKKNSQQKNYEKEEW